MLPINLFFSYSSQLRPLQLHATWPQCCSQLQLQLLFPPPLHCFLCPAGTKNKLSHLLILHYPGPGPGCMVVSRVSRSTMLGPNLAVWCRRHFLGCLLRWHAFLSTSGSSSILQSYHYSRSLTLRTLTLVCLAAPIMHSASPFCFKQGPFLSNDVSCRSESSNY